MKKKLIVLSGFVLGLAPVVALAQPKTTGIAIECSATSAPAGTLAYIVCKVGDLFNLVIPVLIALGVIYFIWGVVSYAIGTEEETKAEGRKKMVYGIIGLAVIVSVWGLVNILTTTFSVTDSRDINFPTTPY